jgi:ribosomal protein S18 acetylase RimI-like enzyme
VEEDDQDKVSKEMIKQSPYMCNVAVDEKYQRRGIASALIARCERQVEDWYVQTGGQISCSLYLRVRESNTAAVRMYSKLNYTSILQEKDKKTGEKLLVMRKELKRRLNQGEKVNPGFSDTPDILGTMVDVASP